MRNQYNLRKAAQMNQSAPLILTITCNWQGFLVEKFWRFQLKNGVWKLPKRWPCIVDFNIITSIALVAGTLVILILGEGLPHLGLKHWRVWSEIFSDGFGAGSLRFIRTWSDKFICHQSYTNIKKLYRRGSLSVFSLPKTSISVYQILLHQAYQLLFKSILQ